MIMNERLVIHEQFSPIKFPLYTLNRERSKKCLLECATETDYGRKVGDTTIIFVETNTLQAFVSFTNDGL